jgi:8-oxo-dGTP pyrophosphatase MutT (NUDIX family)
LQDPAKNNAAVNDANANPAAREGSVPIPAATIMLLRDGPKGLEVFMVVRHHQIDFASGALVFPGGKLDPQDEDVRVLSRLASYPEMSAMQSKLRAAAIREVFEESGILLARDAQGVAMSPDPVSDAWRAGLNKHSLTMGDIVTTGDLTLACDDMVHYSHWITPPMMPKRFDTHFYLARVPRGQIAEHDGHENVDSLWIRPKQVIEDAQSKTRTVIFPTLSNIVRLAQYDSVEAAFFGARALPIQPITPWSEKREDGRYVCIPKDIGYTFFEQRISERPQ